MADTLAVNSPSNGSTLRVSKTLSSRPSAKRSPSQVLDDNAGTRSSRPPSKALGDAGRSLVRSASGLARSASKLSRSPSRVIISDNVEQASLNSTDASKKGENSNDDHVSEERRRTVTAVPNWSNSEGSTPGNRRFSKQQRNSLLVPKINDVVEDTVEAESEEKLKKKDYTGAVKVMLNPWKDAARYFMELQANLQEEMEEARERGLSVDLSAVASMEEDELTMEKRLARRALFHSHGIDGQPELGVLGEEGDEDEDDDDVFHPDRFKADELDDDEDGGGSENGEDSSEHGAAHSRRSTRIRSTLNGDFSKVGYMIWKNAPLGTLLKLAKIGMQLTLAYARLRQWEQVDEISFQAMEVLRGLSDNMNIGSSIGGKSAEERRKTPPRGEETRWAVLMVRRAVACACMGTSRYPEAKQIFSDVLKCLPKERNARRGLEVMNFLEQQLAREYVKEEFEAELMVWTETHSSTGAELHVVEATHRASQAIPKVETKALEILAQSV